MTDPLFSRLQMALLLTAIVSLIVFAVWPGIDLAVARALTDGQGHFRADDGFAPMLNLVLRKGMEIVTYVTILTLPVLWLRGALSGPWKRVWAYVVLNLVLVPGVIVNVILKSHIGRARPETVSDFGGTLTFTPAWQISSACLKNCSFTSGEVALSATWAICLVVLLWPHLVWRGKTLTVAAALGFVLLVSFLRLALGRHFLSDAVFSALFSAFSALALYRLLDIGTARLSCTPQDAWAAAQQALAKGSASVTRAWRTDAGSGRQDQDGHDSKP